MNVIAALHRTMNSPYVVGRWVSGFEHYARQRLIDHLLTARDSAYWVVGTRCMGKSSLLRQLEMITAEGSDRWVPLFWDLQGCTNSEMLSAELSTALEDAAERFLAHGVDIYALDGPDAMDILRSLNRSLRHRQRRLLLLIDEAEMLVDIAAREGPWLSRLRKTVQEGRQRTILASTPLLVRLMEENVDCRSSPFLFGFQQVNLGALGRQDAFALAHQSQSGWRIRSEPDLMEEIQFVTNRQPYLVQCLCRRLFVPEQSRTGYLRPLQEGDLAIDHLLNGCFHADFRQLSTLEQNILLTVGAAGTITAEQLVALYSEQRSLHLAATLQHLRELGQIRRTGDNWAVGNEFLRRWLHKNRDRLLEAVQQPQRAQLIDERNVVTIARQLGAPVDSDSPPPTTALDGPDNFFAAVQNLFASIRHLVEQDDGYRLLIHRVKDSKPMLRTEEEIQIALKHWLRPMCKALDIDLNREPLTGRGYLDFKFSIGHQLKCLVEVKLYNSSKLLDGVGVQLPLYLLADRARHGIYVPIFLDERGYEDALADLHRLAARRSESHGVEIAVMDVRAWKQPSASKARQAELPTRYQAGNWAS